MRPKSAERRRAELKAVKDKLRDSNWKPMDETAPARSAEARATDLALQLQAARSRHRTLLLKMQALIAEALEADPG
jgi:hypothetical protein